MITSFVGDIFFFWVIFFFCRRQQKKILTQTKKNTHQQTKLLIQRKHVYAYDISFLCPPPHIFLPPLPLPPFYYLSNENTLSTETRICLWYAVLLPPYSLCYFIKWGDKHNFSPLHDLLSSTKKHFLYALQPLISRGFIFTIAFVLNTPSWFFWLLTRGGVFKEHVLKMVNLDFWPHF